jgi:ribosomal protein L29
MDARLKLRALAATDLNRHLNEQEEQLLSEIVQAAWAAGNEEPIDISLDRL